MLEPRLSVLSDWITEAQGMVAVTRSVRLALPALLVAASTGVLPFGYFASSSAAAIARCTTSQLSITATPEVGAGGNDGGVLHYRNISSRACSLNGYPTVIATDGADHRPEIAEHRSWGYLGGWQWNVLGSNPDDPTDVATKMPIVNLAPGKGGASSIFQYSENTTYACPKTASILVGLPNSKRRTRVSANLWACIGLEANPIVPGTSGTVS
jgi:hypothetical protein